MISTIATADAPQAIGPYSQARRAGGFVFASGQIALDPASGELVGKDITAQAEQVMRNVMAIVQAAGGRAENIVRTTCYLHDIGDFAAFNEVYARYLGGEQAPARSCVGGLQLPRGALCEVEVTLWLGPEG